MGDVGVDLYPEWSSDVTALGYRHRPIHAPRGRDRGERRVGGSSGVQEEIATGTVLQCEPTVVRTPRTPVDELWKEKVPRRTHTFEEPWGTHQDPRQGWRVGRVRGQTGPPAERVGKGCTRVVPPRWTHRTSEGPPMTPWVLTSRNTLTPVQGRTT